MVCTSGNYQETRTGSRTLHNMSAPPRMTISLKPFPVGRHETDQVAGAQPIPPRLQLLTHVDLGKLITSSLDEDTASPWAFDIEGCRAAQLVLITRRILGKREATIYGLQRHRMERLKDELIANLALIDPISLGLPAFALVRRKPLPGTAAISPEMDPAKALSLISRVAGRVYVARRKPRMASLFKGSDDFWFYGVPVGDVGKEQP